MEEQAVEANEPPTYKELTNEFVDNTNCNGIANIKRSNHVVRKAFWTLLVLAGAALTVKLLVEVFTKFFSYPVSISVNVTYESTVRFPAVTLCNVNMIRKSQLGLMNGSSALDKLTFTVGGNPDITAWATSEGRAMLRHSFVDGWTQLNDTVKKQQGHQIEEMLLDCSYNGENCGPSNFTHFINPDFGNCYTFNSNWENQTILYSHQPGPFYGLMLELFIEQDEYIPELTEVAGVIASIHHQEVMPFPADDGVLIPPDMSSSVSITAETITRKEKPYPSDCLNATFKDAAKFSAYSDIYPVRYTHAACYKTCYQAHLFSECDCGDPSMPLEGQALYNLVTDKNKKRAVCTTQDEITCELKVYKQYANSELECNCSVACDPREVPADREEADRSSVLAALPPPPRPSTADELFTSVDSNLLNFYAGDDSSIMEAIAESQEVVKVEEVEQTEGAVADPSKRERSGHGQRNSAVPPLPQCLDGMVERLDSREQEVIMEAVVQSEDPRKK